MESFFQMDLEINEQVCTFEQMEEEGNCQFIDLRSPLEFEDSRIPGAINIPLFSNSERVEVGTLYKQVGEKAARWRAMEMVSPKIPSILESIRYYSTQNKSVVIYCWRGGMRSKTVAFFANLAGLSILRLRDGYRGYRRYILEKSNQLLPETSFVLHGKTGVGKTEILDLLKEKKFPILDLEKAANHKGSIFGSFGMGEAHSQKIFDSLIYQQMREVYPYRYFILEAESNRIGRVSVPLAIQSSIKNGVHILIKRSKENRIERIYQEYVKNASKDAEYSTRLYEILQQLSKRIKNKAVIDELQLSYETSNYRRIIELLMDFYYDPRYGYKEDSYQDYYVIESDDNELIVKEISRIVQLHQEKAVIA